MCSAPARVVNGLVYLFLIFFFGSRFHSSYRRKRFFFCVRVSQIWIISDRGYHYCQPYRLSVCRAPVSILLSAQNNNNKPRPGKSLTALAPSPRRTAATKCQKRSAAYTDLQRLDGGHRGHVPPSNDRLFTRGKGTSRVECSTRPAKTQTRIPPLMLTPRRF